MMNSTPRTITIEHLMAVTALGPIQTRRDVRAGLLPGRMRGTQYICPPGEFDAYVRGDWRPAPQPQPVAMIQRRKAS